MFTSIAMVVLSALIPLDRPESAEMPRSLSDPMKAALSENYRKAELVLVGRVVRIGPPPPAWSGSYAAFQEVRYRLLRTLKGNLASDAEEFAVAHPVVAQSTTADAPKPGLSRLLFARDAELVLFLHRSGSHLEAFDENLGAVAATPDVLMALERLRTR